MALDIDPIDPDTELEHVPVPLGDVLVSTEVSDDEFLDDLAFPVVSTDRGETWESVDLPGMPPDLLSVDEYHFASVDGAVAFGMEQPRSAREDEDRYLYVYLWVSEDGQAWHGGRVEVPEPGEAPTEVQRVWRRQDGRLVAQLRTRGRGEEEKFIESRDEGRTWQRSGCRMDDFAVASECQAPLAGDLLVNDAQAVSFDDGRTWQDTEFSFEDDGVIVNLQAMERADGGWLGRAESSEDDGSDGWDQSYLVRSDDGIRWERVFGYDSRCRSGFPGEWISMPVPFGSRWMIAYVCNNPKEDGPLLSQLYLVDADGEGFVTIADSRQSDFFYEQPIVAGDAVLVPVATFSRHDISLLSLAPDNG